MKLQERLSPEYSIRYVQTEIENHPQESNLSDMGRIEQTERLSNSQGQAVSGTCPGCFSVLLFYKFEIFGCSQPKEKRYQI